MGRRKRRNKRKKKKKKILDGAGAHESRKREKMRRGERIRVRKAEKAWKESDFRLSDSNLLLLLLPFIVTLDRIDRSVHEPFYPKQPRTTPSLFLSLGSRDHPFSSSGLRHSPLYRSSGITVWEEVGAGLQKLI